MKLLRHISMNFVKRVILFIFTLFLITPSFAQRKQAVIVGISDYPKTAENCWTSLHGDNDIDILLPVLKKQGFNVAKLSGKTATAKRIRKELNNLVTLSEQGDFIYLHFSCHGQPYEDLNGDEEDGWDESIVPYDALMVYQKGKYEGANHITDDELSSYFKKLRSKIGQKGLVCVVIDACHAGGASRGEDDMEEDEDEIYVRGIKKGFSPQGKDFRPRINSKGNFVIPQEAGLSDIIVLEACRSYQSNYEIKQAGKFYGPLSYYIGQVLSKQPFAHSIDWVLEVKKLMNADKRLTRQNMVYETSIK